MNKKKWILSILFFLALIVATFYVIFSNNDMSNIKETVKSIDIKYIIIIIGLIILYFFMQGVYMKLLLKTLNIKISILRGMFYSIVEFFFSGITPSSTGGQPVQLYYMSKDEIPAEKSVIVLLLNTVMFKLFIIVFGFIILFCKSDLIFDNGITTNILFWLGMIIDVAIVIACYLLIFNKNLVKKFIWLWCKFLSKITKKNIDYEEKARKSFK